MADHAYDVHTRAVGLTLAIAAVSWAVALTQMRGMDMGVDTQLGSFGFFVGVWAAMMAAMMLPGALLAIGTYARAHERAGAATLFIATYVGIWTLFGIAAYTIYRPHGTFAAGAITIAAGVYELTPIKRSARQRCRQPVRSGSQLGLHCVRSSIGLMLLLLALGAMSVAWMAVIAAVVVVQKLVPPRPVVDVALALALVALGVVIVTIPAAVPGLVPTM